MAGEEINAFELFKEEMDVDEVSLKVNAIHRLKTVVLWLGPIGTNEKLIPFLDTLVHKEEDEVLFAIAEELGKICTQITNKLTLFPILEQLCGVDETVVREEAVKSLIKLTTCVSEMDIQNVFAPMVIRLAQGEWFTARVSSTSLFRSAYSKAGSFKDKLRKKFLDLCNEENPIIKRASSKKLGDFAAIVEKEFVISEIIPVFKSLSGDEQDQVRVLCISSLISLAKCLTKEENQRFTLTILLAAGEDKSWQVRLAMAKNFPQLAKAFGKDITDNNLVAKFSILMKDVEADVRTAAIKSLGECIADISPEKVASILLPTLSSLLNDSVAGVRSALSEVVGLIAVHSGTALTKEKLTPMLSELIKDDNHDVRYGVVKSIMGIAKVGGPDVITPNLLAGLSSLTQDGHWRVRLGVFEVCSKLAQQFGREYYAKNLEAIFIKFLSDMASAVREEGIEQLRLLVEEFKSEWVIHSYLPKMNEAINKEKQGYLYRMTALNSILVSLLI
eukprot:TRINITY_DN2090_c0_g1_i3.p1 TRINITY_DN2090_c0_g1~~TRINITY_DN2090_c0_g1_i3.p1  ORF type:complete len:514 (-),score=68.91 TRINITY_DN2090_c0_g1_i3:23-1531(-)